MRFLVDEEKNMYYIRMYCNSEKMMFGSSNRLLHVHDSRQHHTHASVHINIYSRSCCHVVMYEGFASTQATL